MQNKGLVRLFAILFTLVSIYQLSFTFVSSKVEGEAEDFAVSKIADNVDGYLAKRDSIEVKYLDSIGNLKVYDIGIADYTYNEVKQLELNKGLDLKGGIDVTLQISVKDILKGLANNTKEPNFNSALERADELQTQSSDPYVESFFEAFDEVSAGSIGLSDPDIFATKELYGTVNAGDSNDKVQGEIRTKIDEAIVSAFEVLRKRIDQFGVTQPNIQREGQSGRIIVQLPGVKDVDRAKRLLQSTAQLEFWQTAQPAAFQTFIAAANQKLIELQPKSAEEIVEDEKSEIDSLLGDVVQDSVSTPQASPLFEVFSYSPYGVGIGTAAIKDTARVGEYLRMPEITQLLGQELRYTKFAWGKAEANSEVVPLYALQANRDKKPPLSGGVVVDASQSYDQQGKPAVSMQMNTVGAKAWEKLTGKVFEENGYIAIVLDNIVYSAPRSNGPIPGGSTQIYGQFSLNEAIDLANVLRAGKLPAKADLISYEVVGPSLGQEAIDSGLMSFLIALVLVLLWMVFYYGKAGLFADVALALNIVLIFGVLVSFGAVLTLPGIAGIVLTIGMSVDANVLLFERVREELAKGKGNKQAVEYAFSWKGAMSSIIDANITTGLTALILFAFGSGPIKGFATTLIIGILTSLFTAIFITRLLIDWYLNKGKSLDFSTTITKNLFRNMTINFINKRKVAYVISGILVAVSVFSLFFGNKLNEGVDFAGGRSFQVRFADAVNPEEVKENVIAAFESAEVKTFGADNQLKITTKYKVDEVGLEVDEEIQQKLFESVQSYLPDGMTYQSFKPGDDSNTAKMGIMKTFKVSPTIADDIKTNSLYAVFGSLLVVFLYILFRFRKWQFSLGAVAAVFHDVLIVLGIFSLTWRIMPFNMEIDQAFIAAILTVIGYSLNDTVVVFDRIREFANDHSSWKYAKIVNGALNSTLSRTLNTSLTTLVVLLAIFIFGGESIRGFMFALIVGVIVGTYSSMFIATPIMYDTTNKGDESKKKE
ncbi:protein translocase subunit SecDF [Spongiivirga sp. MCCC 1A20706]|uniref:protein translocase subunit SecDF n=1 Tax=Spongiivirga sp. MCCC 1A20706 TaxID=3160963 RepID=UPI0039779884